MTYQVLDDNGMPLDAHFDLDGLSIVFHSRGGSRGGWDARNLDYGPALRLLLERISNHSLNVEGAWVDSSQVQGLPIEQRLILGSSELADGPSHAFTLMSTRMKRVGRSATATHVGGNSNKKIRIQLSGDLQRFGLPELLGAVPIEAGRRSRKRLPASDLNKVMADHVRRAVRKLLESQSLGRFAESTAYDLITPDGRRLPPKAVFGLAATEALGREVGPEHFTAGINSPCFRILEDAGYMIVAKGASLNEEVDSHATLGRIELPEQIAEDRQIACLPQTPPRDFPPVPPAGPLHFAPTPLLTRSAAPSPVQPIAVPIFSMSVPVPGDPVMVQRLPPTRREAFFRDAEQARIGARREVQAGSGVADLVSLKEVVEVKTARSWRHALGQVLAYLPFFPECQPRIHLYDPEGVDVEECRRICAHYGVSVSVAHLQSAVMSAALMA